MRYLIWLALLLAACSTAPRREKGTKTSTYVLSAGDNASAQWLDSTAAIYHKRLEAAGFASDDRTVTRSGKTITVSLKQTTGSNEEQRRLRSILKNSARLEFWETANVMETISGLAELEKKLMQADSSLRKDSLDNPHPLFKRLQPNARNGEIVSSPIQGFALAADTAWIMQALNSEQSRLVLPLGIQPAWSAQPREGGGPSGYFELYLLKKTSAGGASISSPGIEEVTVSKRDWGLEISFRFSGAYAGIWKNLTTKNSGKAIAITLDGKVYSCPLVQGPIDGGLCSITGGFSKQEADDLAALLRTSALPVSMRIVSETIR